jgi:hypothetical protein
LALTPEVNASRKSALVSQRPSSCRFQTPGRGCDDRIFADYAVWLCDYVTAGGARDQLVAAMLSTLHERLAIGVPSVDLPLHAESLAPA